MVDESRPTRVGLKFSPSVQLVTRDDGEPQWGRLCRTWLDEGSVVVFPELRGELDATVLERRVDDDRPVGPPGSAWADLGFSTYSAMGRSRLSEPPYSARALATLIKKADRADGRRTGRALEAHLWLRRLGAGGAWSPADVDNPQEAAQLEVTRVAGGVSGLVLLEARLSGEVFADPVRGQVYAERWLEAVRVVCSRLDVVGGGIGLMNNGWSRWEAMHLGPEGAPGSASRIAARSAHRLRGPFWVSVAGRGLVPRDDARRLEHSGAFAGVERLENGTLILRATQRWSSFDGRTEAEVADAVAALLVGPLE